MKETVYFNLLIVFLLSLGNVAYAEVEAPRNPDSAKECAVCHYRWIDTFFIDGRGTELVEYESEKVVAKPEICFSCHDGSVVDSRARIYNDFRHTVNKPPPKGMQIPKIFPLDNDGNMQCYTCHTAHGVPSEMEMDKTIFLRTSNDNSSMCIMCHADKDGGALNGNHPVGQSEKKIPQSLIEHGARIGDTSNHIICETCHTVHGSPNESFLIESARNSRLCLACHTDKNIFTKEGERNHFHVINIIPNKVKIPDEIFERGAKLGYNGEIICQTCHKIHNNKAEKKLLLVTSDTEPNLCLTCHSDKVYIAGTKHNLNHLAPDQKNLEGITVAKGGVCSACHLPHKEARTTGEGENFITKLCLSCHRKGEIAEKAALSGYRHSLNINPFEKDDLQISLATTGIQKTKLTLPLFNKYGIQDINGFITCTTCHDPHKWRSDSTEGEIRKDIRGDNKTSFLRKASPALCSECHSQKFSVVNSKHDMNKVAPDIKNSLNQTPAESGVCGVCHLVHGGQKSYLWARDIKRHEGNLVQDLCIGCHNEEGVAHKKVVKNFSHPVNVSPFEKGLSTTLPLFDEMGDLSAKGLMTCETCHDPHRWDPVKIITDEHYKVEGTSENSFLRLENYPSAELCNNCHPEQMNVEKTDHDLMVTAPLSHNTAGQTPAESGTCGVCHLVHNSPNKLKLWAQEFANGSSIVDRMCNSCHSRIGSGKNKIPEIDSHPQGMLITNVGRDIKDSLNYFPLFNRISGAYMSVGDISCSSCHNVHQWDPKIRSKGQGINIEGSATNSFLRPHTYNLICIDCHGLDALFRFKFYHDPEERVEKTEHLSRKKIIK